MRVKSGGGEGETKRRGREGKERGKESKERGQ